MAATSADRRKLAVLGAGRADWLCIGTSLDALGVRGRVTAPGPDFSDSGSRVLRGPQRGMAPSAPSSTGGSAARPHWGVVGQDGETAQEDVSGRPSTLETSR